MESNMNFIKACENNIEYYTVPEFTRHGFKNIFTTIKSGASFENGELNFGTGCNDTEDAILANYKSVLSLMNSDCENAVKSKQTHSDIVLTVDKSSGGEGILKEQRFIEADGLITKEKDLTLIVFFADCVPVLIADKKTKVISAVHSGWRGTKDNITGKAITKFIEKFGSNPEDIICAIGPAIGVCHFEVTENVFYELIESCGEDSGKIEDGKYYIDLKQAVYNQILEKGVLNIAKSDKCTCCEPDLYSFRRYKETGRMSAFIKYECQ